MHQPCLRADEIAGLEYRTLSGGQKQRLISQRLRCHRDNFCWMVPCRWDKPGRSSALMKPCGDWQNRVMQFFLVVEHPWIWLLCPYVVTVWSIRSGKIVKIHSKQEYLTAQAGYIQDECPILTPGNRFPSGTCSIFCQRAGDSQGCFLFC